MRRRKACRGGDLVEEARGGSRAGGGAWVGGCAMEACGGGGGGGMLAAKGDAGGRPHREGAQGGDLAVEVRRSGVCHGGVQGGDLAGEACGGGRAVDGELRVSPWQYLGKAGDGKMRERIRCEMCGRER